MRFHREEGSVLVADLAVAALVVVVVAALTAAAGVSAEAAQRTAEAARNAAVISARTGDADRARQVAQQLAPPGATVTVEVGQGSAHATVSGRVALPHPVLRRVEISVGDQATQPVAPYRSHGP